MGREKRRDTLLTTSSKGFTTAVAATAAISLCESLFSTHVVLLFVTSCCVLRGKELVVVESEAWFVVGGAKICSKGGGVARWRLRMRNIATSMTSQIIRYNLWTVTILADTHVGRSSDMNLKSIVLIVRILLSFNASPH